MFFREWSELEPSVAYIDPSQPFLITDEKRLESLPPENGGEFSPAIVLESRSHRARFWVDEEGRIMEFKGLTPSVYDEEKINPNSNQPRGLMTLEKARIEAEGINLIGALEARVVELGKYFGDMGKYAQLCRRAKAGGKYFPWARMDILPTSMQLLAELEGVDFETYLHQACVRFGRQLRGLHDAGRTLHTPFRVGTDEPFFSSLHMGNVEIHGNIIDLEGMKDFREAEEACLEAFKADRKNWARIPKELLQQMKDRPFRDFSRLSDLHIFIGGRGFGEGSFFRTFFVAGRDAERFTLGLSGIIEGYYGESVERGEIKGEITNVLSKVKNYLVEEKATLFPFQLTCDIFFGIEKELSG